MRLVDTKHKADQKLIQPTAKDLEESLKNVLLGCGQEAWAGEGAVALLASVTVMLVLGAEGVAGSVGGWVGRRATACWTIGWCTSMQPWEGNLEG